MNSYMVFKGGPKDGGKERVQDGFRAPDAYRTADDPRLYKRVRTVQVGSERIEHVYQYYNQVPR